LPDWGLLFRGLRSRWNRHAVSRRGDPRGRGPDPKDNVVRFARNQALDATFGATLEILWRSRGSAIGSLSTHPTPLEEGAESATSATAEPRELARSWKGLALPACREQGFAPRLRRRRRDGGQAAVLLREIPVARAVCVGLVRLVCHTRLHRRARGIQSGPTAQVP